ncbi:MAG: putative sensor domain DACNV-containing protein [Desulfuromonadaceae bacterium]
MGVSHPSDLAREILQTIISRGSPAPPSETVIRLFQIIYHASISREESEFISFHMVFFNPKEALQHRSEDGVREPWHFIPLECPEEMNLPNISKLALASHPRSSALSVYPNAEGTLVIWGLIDQLNRYEDFIRLENSTAPHRPGMFEARIVGPGHILVTIGYEQIAELKIDNMTLNSIEVFNSGPLRQKLAPGVESLLDDLYRHFPDAAILEEVKEKNRTIWMSVIQRLLFRVKGFKHGGAILIVPNSDFEGLNTKYRLPYNRLNAAVKRYAISGYRLEGTRLRIKNASQEESHLLIKQLAALNSEWRESEKEVEAAIWFVALLTRIDGLVLMSRELEVIGFGVEITTAKEPQSVKKALTGTATKKDRKTFNYSHFGTRHRSMMRYCDANSDSVGFVISQDSDVRAITRVDDDVCMWENFRLLPEITPQDAAPLYSSIL